MSAVHPEEGTASTVLGALALGDRRAQSSVKSRDDASQHEQEAIGAPSNAAEPKPTAAAIAGEETNQEQAQNGQAAAAAAEESGEESDGVGGEGMEDAEGSQTEEVVAATTPSEDSQPGGEKRTRHTVSEEGAVGEGAAKRSKHEVAQTGNGGVGEHAATSEQVEAVSMISTAVSVKVEPRSSQGVKSSTPPQLNNGAGQLPVVAPLESVLSLLDQVVEGDGISQEPEEGAEAGSASLAKTRSGEELEAFLPGDGGTLVPALGHVLQHVLDDSGRSVDLYRIVGRKGNREKACERFSAVVANERVRRLLAFATRKPGVDISFYWWDEPNALRGVVGHSGRLFVNLFSSKSIDEWAKTDLPTTVAHEIAHVRSSTPCNIHSHAWSVEFRKWVRSEDFYFGTERASSSQFSL